MSQGKLVDSSELLPSSILKPLTKKELYMERRDLRIVKYLSKVLTLEKHSSQGNISQQYKRRISRCFNRILSKSNYLSRKYQIIESFYGIGHPTAKKILVFLPELGELSNKRLYALLGLYPDAPRKHHRNYLIGSLFALTIMLDQMQGTLELSTGAHMPGYLNMRDLNEPMTKNQQRTVIRKYIARLNSMIKQDLLYDEWIDTDKAISGS